MKVGVSFLSSNDYKSCIRTINNSSADFLHVDVCDGKYVSTKNFDIDDLLDILSVSSKKLDIHLMVRNPLEYVYSLKDLDIDMFTLHLKSSDSLENDIKVIKSLGFKCAIALNPDEDACLLSPYVDLLDGVLLMSVVPGKGGQEFISDVLDKVEKVRQLFNEKDIRLSIDGGINDKTIDLVRTYDLDLVISGSFVTNFDDYESSIRILRG